MQEDGLFAFERTYLEKLRLACGVLLETAEDIILTDSVESELYALKDRLERALLRPDRPSATP
jgi:hypothetical protein